MATEITLKEFDMSKVGSNKVIVVIGKRNTGKTVLVKDYLYHNQDIPFCACISATESLNSNFSNNIPHKFIFTDYNPKIVKAFYERQYKLTKKKIKASEGRGDPAYLNVDNRGLLLMDDCLADSKQWKNDDTIRKIFMNGRHAGITYILTMQHLLGIQPELRENIDYIFILKQPKRLEQEKIWKHYAGMFPDFNMFQQIFNKVTEDRGVMVIDNTSNSAELEDQVFWYKAKIRNNFKICCPEYWIDNDQYIDSDSDEDNQNILKKYGNEQKRKHIYDVKIIPSSSDY